MASLLCENFLFTGPNSMLVSLVWAPALTTRCMHSTTHGCALVLGKLSHRRPTQNSPPECFGRRAHPPAHPSFSKLPNYRPNLLCPVSTARAPALAYRCIIRTMCGGALILGKLFNQRPKILPRKAVVGAPAVPPAFPIRNFQITGRTFYAPYLRFGHPPWRTAV